MGLITVIILSNVIQKQLLYRRQSHRYYKRYHTVNSNLMQSKHLICADTFSHMLHRVASSLPLSFSVTFLSSSLTKCSSCKPHPLKPIFIAQSFSKVLPLSAFLHMSWIFIGHCTEKSQRKEQFLPCSVAQCPGNSREDSMNEWTNV